MTWRLLYVSSGREFAVLAELAERRLDGYVPCETVWSGPAHKRHPRKRMILPAGYVFADLTEEGFAIARFLPDVIGCLRITSPDAERTRELDRLIGNILAAFIEPIRTAERAGEYDHTRRKGEGLSVGQKVKIIMGKFKGNLATITALRGKHDLRVDIVKMGPAIIAAAKVEEWEAA